MLLEPRLHLLQEGARSVEPPVHEIRGHGWDYYVMGLDDPLPPGMRWAHLPTWTLAVMENRALGREFRPNTKYSIRERFRRRM